jgi:hypothetical protein
MSRRIRACVDCGATPDEAAFPGPRKPSKKPDRCTACAADPGGAAFAGRVAARLAEIGAARVSGRRLVAKPFGTLPLFRERPADATDPRARRSREAAA